MTYKESKLNFNLPGQTVEVMMIDEWITREGGTGSSVVVTVENEYHGCLFRAEVGRRLQ